MKSIAVRWTLRVIYLFMALYAYFGGRCPMEGCPGCKLLGK